MLNYLASKLEMLHKLAGLQKTGEQEALKVK
jgi:hypothetical protein